MIELCSKFSSLTLEQADIFFLEIVCVNLSPGGFIDNGKLSFSDIFCCSKSTENPHEKTNPPRPPAHLMSLNHEGTHASFFVSECIDVNIKLCRGKPIDGRKNEKIFSPGERKIFTASQNCFFILMVHDAEFTLIELSSVNSAVGKFVRNSIH